MNHTLLEVPKLQKIAFPFHNANNIVVIFLSLVMFFVFFDLMNYIYIRHRFEFDLIQKEHFLVFILFMIGGFMTGFSIYADFKSYF